MCVLSGARHGDGVEEQQRDVADEDGAVRRGVLELGVTMRGADGVFTRVGQCCHPLPGEDVVGYITRGRGVTIHRVGCSNLNNPNLESERLIEVTWDAAPDQTFQVKLIILAQDRRNLLAEISQVCANEGANIQSGEFSSENEVARATLVIEVRNLNNLQRILRAVGRVSGVEKIDRYQLN